MPTLHWIGKDKVINHHMDVPFRVLEHSYGFDNGKQSDTLTNSGNKIIHGDNLEALKALLPEYEGKIKCTYIDPPYNTGQEKWVYNDSVNDPKIKKWLGEVVGKESEDLSRHDKWLCMMYPRLKLIHKLLSNEGVIFISIDENEVSHLRLVMDEIFGSANFVEQIVWNKRVPKNDKNIGNIHEYILLYVKNKAIGHRFSQSKDGIPEINDLLESLKKKKKPIIEAETEIRKLYKKNNYDRGITLYNNLDKNYKLWGKINVSWPNGQTFGPRYDVIHPISKKPCKVPDRGWRWTEDTFNSLLDYNNVIKHHDGSYICGKIWFAKDENTQPSSIKYLDEVSDFLLRSIISTKSEGAISLKELSDERFDYPKPLNLLEILLNSIDCNDGIILDSFAGSSTTGHAVLNLNKKDDGTRKFILIEMEDYAETITVERVKRAIIGYGSTDGTGGMFDYYSLGEPMFLEDGMLNELVGVGRIRQYVYYTETNTPLVESKHNDNEYYMGVFNDTAYYFNYEQDGPTTLDHDFLATIKTKAMQYVIYADNCLLTKDYLAKHNIIFKKIPRDITKF